MNTAEAIEKTLKDIEAMEAANKALPEIKKVVTKWDGKCFNKRFDADLKALNLPGHIYMSTSDENRYTVQYSPNGSNQWFTILFTLRPSNKYYDPEKSFLGPDKRLNREKAFDQIESGRIERLKTIKAYKDYLATREDTEKMLEILRKQIATITATIPYTLQDYFNIRRR